MKKAIGIIMMFFLFLWAFTLPAAAELMAHWTLDEDSGDIAYDSQGNYNGIIHNPGAITQGSPGVFGTSYLYTSRSGYIETNNSYNVGTNDFTFAAWVNPAWNAYGSTLLTNRASDATQYTLYLAYTGQYRLRPSFNMYNGNNTVLSAAEDIITNGSWYQIVGVREGNLMSIYVDGILSNTFTDSSVQDISTATSYYIGNNGVGSLYQGYMDDVGFWNESLDANEINAVYDLGIEKFEALKGSINDTWCLGYTTEDIAMLAQLYTDGKAGLDPLSIEVDNKEWTYLSGDLPGDIGGTTYDIGDSWIYGGKYYIKLGSGLEGGAVPEIPPFAAQGMMLAFGSISLWVKKRRIKVSQNQSVRE